MQENMEYGYQQFVYYIYVSNNIRGIVIWKMSYSFRSPLAVWFSRRKTVLDNSIFGLSHDLKKRNLSISVTGNVFKKTMIQRIKCSMYVDCFFKDSSFHLNELKLLLFHFDTGDHCFCPRILKVLKQKYVNLIMATQQHLLYNLH